MAERKRQPLPSLLVQDNQPLIGIPFEEKGQVGVRYFTDEKAADAAVPHSTTQAALSVIGAWSDMDWEEMVEALDRMRHESNPPRPSSYEALSAGHVASGCTAPCPSCCGCADNSLDGAPRGSHKHFGLRRGG